MQFLENLVQSISTQILPTSCIACQQFQAESICASCLNALENSSLLHYECCYQCSAPLKIGELVNQQCASCKIEAPYFDETHCLDRYDGILQDALHQFKYQKRVAFAHGLAKAWNQIQFALLERCYAHYLLPVPLSQQKLLARGFNQSWELARRIHCNSNVQKLPYALCRHHHLDQQAGNTLVARRDAIHEMFYIDPQYRQYFKGKTVIVFDDVITSGATLNEIARILKEIGVLRVINWVLLRTTRIA
jgi:ComF family protein